jgi:hypothetical protein
MDIDFFVNLLRDNKLIAYITTPIISNADIITINLIKRKSVSIFNTHPKLNIKNINYIIYHQYPSAEYIENISLVLYNLSKY